MLLLFAACSSQGKLITSYILLHESVVVKQFICFAVIWFHVCTFQCIGYEDKTKILCLAISLKKYVPHLIHKIQELLEKSSMCFELKHNKIFQILYI